MKCNGDACAFMKTCANAHFCVKLLRLYATCFCAGLLFYFVEVYFGLYFAAVDVPPSSSMCICAFLLEVAALVCNMFLCCFVILFC